MATTIETTKKMKGLVELLWEPMEVGEEGLQFDYI